MSQDDRQDLRSSKVASTGSLQIGMPETTTPLLAEPQSERRSEVPSPRQDAPVTRGSNLNGEPDNPLEWSAPFKWNIVALLAATGFVVTFTCTSVVPVANTIVDDLQGVRPGDRDRDRLASVLPVTIWEVGEAVGPLLIAPLSEMYGRYPLMNAANMLFVTGTVLAALSPTMSVFIASRALTGMAVASNVLNPAIVGDMFVPEQRGVAMSLVGFSPLLGGTVGPAFSGVVAQNFGWRPVLWASVVLASVCEFVFFTYFRETYWVVILRRRHRAAAELGKQEREEETEDENGKPALASCGTASGGPGEMENQHSTGLLASLMRPAIVLFSSGVLAALSLFGSSVFAHFYILATTLPSILEELYGLSPAATGSAFLANGIGSGIALIICKMWLDRIYTTLRASNHGIGLPEHRLPMAVVSAFMLPVALALYGWCAQHTLPLPLLLACVVLIRIFIVMINLPLMAYVVDACGLYSASAFTGVIVIRCLAGAFLPLGTAELIKDVGYGWGFTVLGAVSLALAFIPLLLLRYGSRWRKYCKYTLG